MNPTEPFPVRPEIFRRTAEHTADPAKATDCLCTRAKATPRPGAIAPILLLALLCLILTTGIAFASDGDALPAEWDSQLPSEWDSRPANPWNSNLLSSVRNPLDPTDAYPFKTHREVPTPDLAATGYAPGRLTSILDEIDGKYTQANPDPLARIRLRAALGRLNEEIGILYTRQTLTEVRYDRNVGDDMLNREKRRLDGVSSELTDRTLLCLSRVLAGPFGDVLSEQLTKDEEAFLWNYSPATREDLALEKQDDALLARYDRIVSREDDPVALAAAACPVFQQQIALRNRIAESYGYGSYADYADWALYGRDYDSRKAANLRAAVRKYIVPVYVRFSESSAKDEYAESHLADSAQILRELSPCLARIHPDLMQAFNYMRRNRLADLDYSKTKSDEGYTQSLPQYGSAIIFNQPDRSELDYMYAIHEFGHYNAMFHDTRSPLFSEDCLDVDEIQSQGLEMLFLPYYDELFGADADAVRRLALADQLDGVVSGCMYDEFQRTVYAHPDMTPEQINALSARLCREYGMVDSGCVTAEEAPYAWASVDHNFSLPMYYLSYATSGLTALELYLLSRDDPAAATNAYMRLSAMGSGTPYSQAILNVGLGYVFNPAFVRQLADRLSASDLLPPAEAAGASGVGLAGTAGAAE